MIGNTLSHYRIIEKLGQGGMGEVYLAEDSRLDRKIALKILPEHLSDKAELRERFEREARAVSSLNHPHICTLHDIGEQDGIHYLVMEHLEGETLSARLEKGSLPLEQTLEYAIQIADALEAAHKQNIVHRDLKPSNIMLTLEGHVKVMDFGLAKRVTPAEGQEEEITTKLTKDDSFLGTVPYMSPEQLRGQEVDARSDIFSFGVVLYEMLAGVHPYKKVGQIETANAILSETASPLSRYTNDISSLLQRAVKKMLAKEPDRRYQLVHEIRTDLAELIEESGDSISEMATGLSGVSSNQAWWQLAIPWSITVMVALIAGVAIWSLTRPSLRPLTEFVITPPPTVGLANLLGNELAISPDGRRIVYLGGTRQLYVRSLDALRATPIAGTEGVDRNFFFSPDGQSLVFVAGGKLKRVSLLGGAPITLCDAPLAEGGSWGPGDTIVFAADLSGSGVGAPSKIDTGLHRVSANGGQPESLAMPDPERGEEEYQHPQILPGGKAVLFDIFRGSSDYQTAVLSLETGEQKILVEGGRNPRYAPTGHLVYELDRTGTLMAVLFDLDNLEVTGGAVPILEGVRYARLQGDVDYSFSANGTLVYVVGGGSESTVVWVDREGTSEPLLDTPGAYWVPRLSPDGHRLAVADVGEGQDIWIYDLKRDVLSRLTFDPGADLDPLWTPDGQRIVFRSNRSGASNLYWKPADGSGEAEQLTSSEQLQIPYSWTPDGKVLAFWQSIPQSASDIWVLRLDGDRTPEPFLHTPFREAEPSFSPDSRWIAYTSDESGRPEIYVRAFPGSSGKWQISTGGGIASQWAASGRELFYLNGDQMMVVPVTIGDSFQAGTPRSLFTHVQSGRAPPNYAVARDGKRFVMLQPTGPEVEPQINVVLNWFEELKRLVPTN